MESTEENKFKPGDVVKTKFGGPRMTIAWRMTSRIVTFVSGSLARNYTKEFSKGYL